MRRLLLSIVCLCLSLSPAMGQAGPWDSGQYRMGCSPNLSYCATGDERFELRRPYGPDALWSVAVLGLLAPDQTLRIEGPEGQPALTFPPGAWRIDERPDRALLLPSGQTDALLAWIDDSSIEELRLIVTGAGEPDEEKANLAFLREGRDWVERRQPKLPAPAAEIVAPAGADFAEQQVALAQVDDLGRSGGLVPASVLAAHARLSPECTTTDANIGAKVMFLGGDAALFKLNCSDDYDAPGARLYIGRGQGYEQVELLAIPLWQPWQDSFVTTAKLPGHTALFAGISQIWTEFQEDGCSLTQSVRLLPSGPVLIEASGWNCRHEADGTVSEWEIQLYLAPEESW